MNILTFDIEEWALEATRQGGARAYRIADFNNYLDYILNLLDETGKNATFFCTGQMAEQFPYVLQQISVHGHEIACHSYKHTWVNKMTRQDFEEDTRRAIDRIEQCIGKKVLGYRAPAFSITKTTPYAFEVLAQNGIKYDASIFPAQRDFGGYPSFASHVPCIVQHNGIKIQEFPIPTTSIFGHNIAYSGGGYFRLLPYDFIQYTMRRSNFAMTYFHIGDLINEPKKMMTKDAYEAYFKEKGTLKNRIIRYIKSSIGTANALNKLEMLIRENDFVNVQEAIRLINWKNVPTIQV